MAKKINLPSVMAFSRKLEVSDGLMASGLWADIDRADKWEPIKLFEKRNRATHSSYGTEDKKKSESNLSWGDDAALPHGADTLRVIFTLKILGGLKKPVACNDPAYEQKLGVRIEEYQAGFNFHELALRYAHNIVNARFLWRNRVGADSISVQVKHKKNIWNFNSYSFELDNFSKPTRESDLGKLVEVIRIGLQDDNFEHLEITSYSKLGLGQRVWPSQEMVLNIPKGEKSRILFHLNKCAAMHSEKIGNALRTIDTWYGDAVTQAIAVEPYGSVTTRGVAHRVSNNDFYTLLNNWISPSKDRISDDEQHYIIAILIRGGVFTKGNNKKSKQTESVELDSGTDES